MKDQNIDALLMFRQESMYWLTGYDTFGYVFFQTLVLDQKGNIILLTRAPDLRQAQNTSNIEDIRIWVDKDNSQPTDDLKIILDELNLKGKKIGIEYESYGMTGLRATQPDQVDSVIAQMLETPGPVIVDMVVSKEENCLPMIPGGAAHNEILLGLNEHEEQTQSEDGMVLV